MTESASTAVIAPAAWSSTFTKRLATLARARRARLELVLAVAVYLGFACQLTWPLVLHFTHSVYSVPGDPFGTMALYRELANQHLNPFLPGTLHQFAAPQGLPIPWPRNLASAPGVLSLYLLAFLFGGAPALSVYTLAGYVLTGTVTFLFARRLTGNAWAALIAGWAYAFYPFAALNGLGHNDNVQGWVLMLAVWRMVELMWHPSRRNGLLAGLAVAFGMWWSPYFILFVGVAYVTIATTTLLLSWHSKHLRQTFIPQLIAALIVVIFLAFLGILSTLAAAGLGVRVHGLGDLYAYSARPLEYLLPDIKNPIFGGLTRHYIETHQHGSGNIEDTLYVGLTIILLALVAVAACVRHRLTHKLASAVLVLSLLSIVAVITSMPPENHIFGVTVPFPSHFISLVTTTWRVYSRFVMIVMLALSLLAAVGLDVLTRKRSPRTRITIMLLATILVPLDLWYHTDKAVIKLSTPGIYKTLARLPKGLVAEYPLPADGYDLYSDFYYHNIYNMPMINGYPEGSVQESRASLLFNLAEPSTAAGLATLGVKYVLVEATPSSLGLPPSGEPGAGFHLIKHEPYGNLYTVTASPTILVTPGNGFIPLDRTAGRDAWLDQTSGVIELVSACTHCEGTLSMILTSYAKPRQVTIRNSGENLGKLTVRTPLRVSVFLHFDKHTRLELTATPGPQTDLQQPEFAISVAIWGIKFTKGHSLS